MLILFLFGLIAVQAITATNERIIDIKNGKIQGVGHDNYFSFEGIPYAVPPIEENRFESPKPYEKTWTDTLPTTTKKPNCIQNWDPLSLTHEINGEEDCLYLNVYTPDLDADKLYPVLFYIHGGGLMYGSGNLFQEKYIMKHQNFVLVTFNYRLGALGFLSTCDTEITGNMGLKDQLTALKWVKENIRSFNGDPDKILISGYSAGSASVEYLTMTPGIENLASAAFGMSGSVLNSWSLASAPKESAIKLGKLLDCPTDSSASLKKCLKEKSAESIVETVPHFRNFMGSSIGIFAPVAESNLVTDAIITEHPKELLINGKFSKIPHLISYTSEDGGLFTASIMSSLPEIIKSGNEHFLMSEPGLIEGDDHHECSQIFGDISKGNYATLNQLLTRRVFSDDIKESIKLRKTVKDSKTFAYVYNNPSSFGLCNLISNRTDIDFGACHSDDTVLILNFPQREDVVPLREDEKVISDHFIKMLETFVNTGKPIFGDVEIPVLTPSDDIKYLNIAKDKYTIETFENY